MVQLLGMWGNGRRGCGRACLWWEGAGNSGCFQLWQQLAGVGGLQLGRSSGIREVGRFGCMAREHKQGGHVAWELSGKSA